MPQLVSMLASLLRVIPQLASELCLAFAQGTQRVLRSGDSAPRFANGDVDRTQLTVSGSKQPTHVLLSKRATESSYAERRQVIEQKKPKSQTARSNTNVVIT